MTRAPLPSWAAWRHRDALDGFEVVFFTARADGTTRAEGHTATVEDGEPYAVRYEIERDARGHTRTARVHGRARAGAYAVELEADGEGGWRVGGTPAPELAGCLDVDLEASALTNAFPVHRLRLQAGDAAAAPAAYVRALDGAVERLEQSYERLAGDGERYDYRSPAYDFRCELSYDAAGLVLDYPGIAARAA